VGAYIIRACLRAKLRTAIIFKNFLIASLKAVAPLPFTYPLEVKSDTILAWARVKLFLWRAREAVELEIFAQFFLRLTPTTNKGLFRSAHHRRWLKKCTKRALPAGQYILQCGAVYKIVIYTEKMIFQKSYLFAE
jgi:hypothetical protein